LLATRDEFTQEADRETENFKSLAYRTFAKSMDIMEDIFSNIETWAIAETALKAQIDIIRDIIVQLPEVKNNEKIIGI
jgi:hypothetical protein